MELELRIIYRMMITPAKGEAMAEQVRIETAALARLFSAGVIRELGFFGKSPLFARLVRESRMSLESEDQKAPVSQLYDIAFKLLRKRGNRYEYVYKAAVTQKVLLGTHSLRTSSMLNEFRAGSSVADVVILNRTSTVYEIKSERDSLKRLEQQIHSCSQVFATINVIVGENHLSEVIKSVPEYVGILLLTDRYHIRQIRPAIDDASRTVPEKIFDSITLRESKIILQDQQMPIPDVSNAYRYLAWREEFAKLDPVIAHSAMVRTLKKTRNLEPLESMLRHVPKSLYFSVLSLRLKFSQRNQLVTALQTPIRQALDWG